MTQPLDWLKTLARRGLPFGIQKRIRAFYLTRKVLSGREFVEPEMKVISCIVSQGQFVLDIGANVGFYTILLSRLVGSSGKVYSFEPISQNYEILQNVVRDGHLSNVQIFHAAVDQKPGELDMVIPDRQDFTGFYQARLAEWEELGRKERVKVVSLDDLMIDGTLKSVDFIKCDAEGNELRILLGASGLLKQYEPSLLLEVQRKKGAEVFNLLYGLGYRSYRLEGSTFVEVRGFNPTFWNYFFFSPKRRLQASLN
jgi:FkbM family methyltransferase